MTLRSDEISMEAARRMAKAGMSASERKARRGEFEAGVAGEVAALAEAAATAQAAAEATQERARIAAVTRLGASMGRAQAALRLALAGPITEAEARAVLTTLPMDTAGPAAALPAVASFGTTAERAERARIVSILNCEEAKGRARTAQALTLDTGVDLATAATALAGVPKADPQRYPSLAQRSAEAGDFGFQPQHPGYGGGASSADDLWRKALAATEPRGAAAFVSGGPSGPVAAGSGGDAPARSAELAAQAARWADEERGIGGK